MQTMNILRDSIWDSGSATRPTTNIRSSDKAAVLLNVDVVPPTIDYWS